MHTSVGTVVRLAGRHDTRFVRIRTLDEEDELVTHVPMRRERRPRLEARQQGAALGALVFPDSLLADSWARLDPRQFAQREDLRRRRAPREVACSISPVRTASTVAPFLVVTVWTQPSGR